jgi:hypothetical protein
MIIRVKDETRSLPVSGESFSNGARRASGFFYEERFFLIMVFKFAYALKLCFNHGF